MTTTNDDLTRSGETTASPSDVHASGNEPARKVLTIERAKWRRGGDAGYSDMGPTKLLNRHGFMCCLGFDAIACGLTEDIIRDKNYPSSLVTGKRISELSDYARTRVTKCSYGFNDESAPAKRAVKANDGPFLSEAEREAAVRAALVDLGWDDVVFV